VPVNVSNPEELRGVAVNGSGGDRLGRVEDVYLDNDTGRPEWASVKTGLFGGHVSLVPMSAAEWNSGELTVPFGRSQVKEAPHHDPGREISEADERELFTYYGIPYGGDPLTAPGDVAMTRSEERVHVGTEVRESGRARLRKYITTETVTQTVSVRHEEVTISREPITEANADVALSGGELTEEVIEITLHEERPVVAKETVAVERIRLDTREVVEEQTVSAEIRKENIEVEGVDDTQR
jgi:uncharacterized protein (TIGR02271 family)